jgi:NADH-quinone oxidoreductase subunit L
MFHLFTHAFFKALLFLGAGSVIHAMHHEQDMRRMGGLRKAKIPLTFWMMMIGTLALTGVGIPRRRHAGFFSKDAIIEAAFAAHNPCALCLLLLVVAALLHLVLFLAADLHDLPRQAARRSADVMHHVHESRR